MATLPIGFFMPLPLPIMIPFMMWQSAAIAAGFGTYFQYAKRRISAMSNDEFNKFNPSDGVNSMFDDIMSNIPSSFERIRSLNTLILQSMADFLEDGIRFLSGKLGGQLNQGFQFEGPPTADLPDRPTIEFQNPFVNPLPQAFPEEAPPGTLPFVPQPTSVQFGPPAPPLTQQQLLDKYANWKTYRSKGGLLTEQQWRVARRGREGGIPDTRPQAEEARNLPQGRIHHPQYIRQLKSLQNNRNAIMAQREFAIKERDLAKKKYLEVQSQSRTGAGARTVAAFKLHWERQIRNVEEFNIRIKQLQDAMNEFVRKFKPN